MFSQDESNPEMEGAFQGGQACLQMLSMHSPQAQLYFEICSNLYDAIKEHQQQISSQKGSSRKSFVTRIFSMNSASDSAASQKAGSNGASTFIDSGDLSSDSLVAGSPAQIGHAACGAVSGSPGNVAFPDLAFDNIDSVALQLWDDFVVGQTQESAVGQDWSLPEYTS